MIKGCRRFQSWHAVVEGPLKPLHDKRGQETLMITMHLQRNKFRPQNAPFWPSPHPQAIDSYRIDVSYPMTQSISHSSSSTLQNQSANNYPDTISQPTGSSPSRTTELSPFEQTRPLSEYDFLWPMTDQPGALIYGSGGMGQLSYPQDPFPPFLSDGREEIGSQEDSNFHLETCLSFENMGNVSTYDPRFDFNITNQKLYYEALN
jgi:hypothetical protein